MREGKMDLSVVFDRSDRLYRLGDVITGKLVLQPTSDRSYSEIKVAYRWRTHGQGDRDEGTGTWLTLAAEKIKLKAGERREFSFRLNAPDGPVTYHGNYLNVDWYVAGHANSGPLHHVKSEQDFLLLGPDRAGAITEPRVGARGEDVPPSKSGAGYRSDELKVFQRISSRVPRPWPTNGVVLAAIVAAIVFAFLVYVFRVSLLWTLFGAIAASLAVVGGLIFMFLAVLRSSYKLALEFGEVWIRPIKVNPGSDIRCHLDFVAKRNIHLGSITASILLRERVEKTQGTTKETRAVIVEEKYCTRTFDEDLHEGRRVVFECTLPVASDAPPSFSSDNNRLEWIVTMSAELTGWPGWSRSFALTVSP
jgi:hypothetical protein